MGVKNMSLNDLADWLESCGYTKIAIAIRLEILNLNQEKVNYLYKTLANYPNPLKILAGTGITHGKGTKL